MVWDDFDRTYPYFIHKKLDWDSVHEVYSAKINDDISSRDLFELIGEMTLVLEDIHVYVKSSYGTVQFSRKENYPENPPDLTVNYLDEVSVNNSRGIFGKIANSNYSYIRIKSFVGDESDFNTLYSSLGR